MHVSTVHIRSVHETPNHRVPLPDVCRPSLRVLLDQRVRHQTGAGLNTSRKFTSPFHQHIRRRIKFKHQKSHRCRWARYTGHTKLCHTVPVGYHIQVCPSRTSPSDDTEAPTHQLHGTLLPCDVASSSESAASLTSVLGAVATLAGEVRAVVVGVQRGTSGVRWLPTWPPVRQQLWTVGTRRD